MNNQPYLRPKKYESLKSVESSLIDRSGNLKVQYFGNSMIIPRGQIVGIQNMASDETIIDDIDYCCDIVPSTEKCEDCTVLYAGYFRHQWGHFLLNSTARLWWIVQSPDNLKEIDKIIFIATPGESVEIDGNFREFFHLLGIIDKIEIIHSTKGYRNIIVPDIAFEHDRFYAREIMAVFERVRDAALMSNTYNKIENKKIFLTRSKLPKANFREVNLKYFDNVFSRNGFQIIYPEQLSLSELISLMDSCSDIISVSGSTAHNLIFAPKGSSTYVIERAAPINLFQANISLLTGQPIHYIDAFLYPSIPIPSGNVFYYYPTCQFSRFMADNAYESFNEKEFVRFQKARNVYKFLFSLRLQSGYVMALDGNALQLEAIAEAYADTLNTLGNILSSTPLKRVLRAILHPVKSIKG